MKTYFVVTGIVKHEGNYLILKRADDDRNYPGKWSFCSGFVKEFESAEDACLREIEEEVGLLCRIFRSDLIDTIDEERGIRWVVAVFLCEADDNEVKLGPENTKYKWVKDFKGIDLVPGIWDAIERLGL